MDARPRLMVVVEIKVWVVRTDRPRVEPANTEVPEEYILAPPAVIGTVALTDRQKVFVIGLVGENEVHNE